jgi:hypothetical protein
MKMKTTTIHFVSSLPPRQQHEHLKKLENKIQGIGEERMDLW